MSSKLFQVTDEEIQKHVFDLYGFQINEIVKFEGYDDLNFGLTSATGEKFVAKVSRDHSVEQLLELNRLMTFLSDNGFKVPVPIKLKNCTETLVKITIGDEECSLRLFHFVSGDLLKSTKIDRDLLKNGAEHIAKLHLVLKDFKSDIIANREYIWLIKQAPNVKSLLTSVKDESNKKLVVEVLDEFQEKMLHLIDQLPQSVIHGDLNEANMLVSPNALGQMEVTGLIDFSDVDFAPRVFDLAIFCLYMLLETGDVNVNELIEAYCKLVPLTDIEKSMVPICMKARLAQSLVIGAHSYEKDPSNEYVLKTASNGWRILKELK